MNIYGNALARKKGDEEKISDKKIEQFYRFVCFFVDKI